MKLPILLIIPFLISGCVSIGKYEFSLSAECYSSLQTVPQTVNKIDQTINNIENKCGPYLSFYYKFDIINR